MLKIYLLTISVFITSTLLSQTERVYFHTDKLVCYPGDTIWFRGYIFNDSATASSTSIYAELWDDSSRLLTRKVFQAYKGTGFGQMEIPETTGIYWLRGYTLNAKGYPLLAITVRDKTKKVPIKSFKVDELPVSDSSISLIKDSSGYTIRIKEGINCSYSLSVVDANEPSYPIMMLDKPIFTFAQFDTALLSYSGKLYGFSRQERKKKYLQNSLVVIIKKDSINSVPQTIPIDSNGMVSFGGLTFFGTAKVQYQVNHSTNPNIQLMIDPRRYPTFYAPTVKAYKKDTTIIPYAYDSVAGYKNAKQLKEVIVKASWRAQNDALDKRYNIDKKWLGGWFWAQDIRDTFMSKKYFDFRAYLAGPESPWPFIKSQNVPPCYDGLQCYVDDKKVTLRWLIQESVIDYAFVKVTLDGVCPALCIYSRKGSDWEGIPGRMRTVNIKGYDQPLKWQTPDKTTLLWEPYLITNNYKLPVFNKTVRVVVMGVTDTGFPLYFEKIIP